MNLVSDRYKTLAAKAEYRTRGLALEAWDDITQ